jgi:hypothetical protein
MAVNNYDPSTALSAYYPTRDERRPARLWAREKLLHDMADAGMVEFFEGPGSNPTALLNYGVTKLWLRVSSGVTSSPGEIRAYDGGGVETDIANWPVLTRGAFLDFLGVRPDLGRFETRADAIASVIAPSVNGITTLGYASAGDGGSASYKRVSSEPSHAGKFQSADGAWWEMVRVGFISPLQFGAVGDSVADDTAAMQAWLLSGTRLWLPGGYTFRVTDTLALSKRDAVHVCGDGGGPNGLGSSLIYWDGAEDGTVFLIHSCRHCTVERIGIQGILGGLTTSPGTGIFLTALNADGSSHFNTIRDCTISQIGGSPGYGIMVGSETNDDIAHNIIQGNRIVGGGVSVVQFGTQTVHNIYRDNQCLDYESKGMQFIAGDVRVENPGMFGAASATVDIEIGSGALWASVRGAYHEILDGRPIGAEAYGFPTGARTWPTELDACRVLWNRTSGNIIDYRHNGALTVHDCTFDTSEGGGTLTVVNGSGGSAQLTRFGNLEQSGIAWSVSGMTEYGAGYRQGAGGVVTQETSRTTGVTIDKLSGSITLYGATGSTSPASFTVTNALVEATDTVVVSQKSGVDLYNIRVTQVADGSFRITSWTTGGTTSEQPVFNFTVIKGAAD